jgi:hypothetical protein
VFARLVGGLLGGLAGGLATAALVMIFALEHWLVVLPILVGVTVGALGGDRGLLRLLRFIGNVF